VRFDAEVLIESWKTSNNYEYCNEHCNGSDFEEQATPQKKKVTT